MGEVGIRSTINYMEREKDMSNVSTMITDNGISVFFLEEGNFQTIGKDHPNFTKVKEAIAAKEFDRIVPLLDRASGLKEWARQYGFEFVHGTISLHGRQFSQSVGEKALAMMDDEQSGKPLLHFLMKVDENPSKVARDELLLFCVANDFLIHESGDIISFKGIRGDYMDLYSGKVSNHVGAVLSMPRNAVDDSRDRACSYGFHTGSWEYASNYGRGGGRVMTTRVNPKDVVSIPYDSGNQKMRTCRYEVIAEVENFHRPPVKQVYVDEDINAGRVRTVMDVCFDCGHVRRNPQQDCPASGGYHSYVGTLLSVRDRVLRYLAGVKQISPELVNTEATLSTIFDTAELFEEAMGYLEDVFNLNLGFVSIHATISHLVNKVEEFTCLGQDGGVLEVDWEEEEDGEDDWDDDWDVEEEENDWYGVLGS